MLDWLFGRRKQPEPEKKPEKPKKTQSEQEAQDKWMYEFVVQFLNSPIWRVTILDFCDTKCVVFDNQEENKFQYTIIHNEFKQLVGNLFDGMMQEVGLTDEKLAEIIQKGFQSKEKKLFNQLLLCDDFLKFKDLMLRRNKALETEALKALNTSDARRPSRIDRERDLIRESKKFESERRQKVESEEEQILRKVLEMSKKEAEEREAIENLEIQAAENQIKKIEEEEEEEERIRASQLSQKTAQTSIKQEPEQLKEEVAEETPIEMKSKVMKKKLDPVGGSKLSDLPPLKNPHFKASEIKATLPKQTENEETNPEVIHESEQIKEVKEQKKQQSNIEKKQDRKKRLQEQRERIKKKKEEQRKKMMEEQFQQKPVQNIVLQDDGIHQSTVHRNEQTQEKVSKDEINRRKAIMNKIKKRIVDDF